MIEFKRIPYIRSHYARLLLFHHWILRIACFTSQKQYFKRNEPKRGVECIFLTSMHDCCFYSDFSFGNSVILILTTVRVISRQIYTYLHTTLLIYISCFFKCFTSISLEFKRIWASKHRCKEFSLNHSIIALFQISSDIFRYFRLYVRIQGPVSVITLRNVYFNKSRSIGACNTNLNL